MDSAVWYLYLEIRFLVKSPEIVTLNGKNWKRKLNLTDIDLSKDFLTIFLGWSTETEKKMSTFWPKNWSWSLKKFERWTIMIAFLKQYLNEKQNGYLQNGLLREVVARRELTW